MATQDYCHKRLSQSTIKEDLFLFIKMGGLVNWWFS
ncbi:MAG: hypothetical protein ACJAXN_000005 [Psychromonas sp.]|jgi:hypothetical protein